MSNRRTVIRGASARRAAPWRPGDLAAALQPAVVEPEEAAAVAAIDPVAAAPAQSAEPEVRSESPEVALQAELEALRSSARAEGHAAGHAEGLARGAQEAQELRALLDHLKALVEDLEQGIATDVLSLSLELAKLIVRRSLRVRPELVLEIIREAAKTFPDLGNGPRLILHPADAELVRQSVGEESVPMPWSLVEDPKMERGGCKFQNATTEIDATLENRWRRVVASLGRDDAWLDLNL